jgi:bifunctional DNA-binding transcriptional regulator/antitoxin component of YhaV-PrlF toxin-antitoxin module
MGDCLASRPQGGAYISFPPVGLWEMSAIVELDGKGRVLIPAEVRNKFRTKRFRVSAREGVLELEPLVTVQELRGKYHRIIKAEWEDLEAKGEDYVAKRR